MHLRNKGTTSKTEYMHFPTSFKHAKKQTNERVVLEKILLPDGKRVHFASIFEYLGSTITPLLNKDTEIEARIKKAKSIMGTLRHFFDN
jgi:hypothetical protein